MSLLCNLTMDKTEIIRFVRCVAYTNIFIGPFTKVHPLTAGAISLASLAVLHLTDC